MRHWCSIAGRIALVVSSAAAVGALVELLLYPPPNQCDEGTEAPVYTTVDIDGARRDGMPDSYRLLQVTEASVPAEGLPSAGARAVLFVPGSAGAFTQVKSMCAEAAKAGLPLTFYTVDLGSELVAFRGELLERQVRFVRHALQTVARLQHQQYPMQKQQIVSTTPPLLAVGHSMGGLVLRAALRSDMTPRSSAVSMPRVTLLLTLGTPHAPVVVTEASVMRFYEVLDATEPQTVPIPVVSVSGGDRDIQVPAHLCELSHRPGGRAVDLPAQAIRGVRGSVDHQCLSWCLPLIPRLNKLLVTVAMEAELQHDKQLTAVPRLDHLLWNVPTTGSLRAIQMQPATFLKRGGPTALPVLTQRRVAGNVGAAEQSGVVHAYLLQLQRLWVAAPQQLTVQCVNNNDMKYEVDSWHEPRLFMMSTVSPAGVGAPIWIPTSAVAASYTTSTVISYSYQLNPTGWGRRSRVLTAAHGILDESQEISNDVILVVDFQPMMDTLSADAGNNSIDCTVELTPNYMRAVGVLGHHQLGVIPSATTSMLMMLRGGVRRGLSSVALWNVCLGVIVWVHDIPLLSMVAMGGGIEVIAILWSVTSTTLIVAGLGLLCGRYLRQFLDIIPNDGDTSGTNAVAAARSRRMRRCAMDLLRLACAVLFLLHPFEAFILLCCVHRWLHHTPLALQSPKLSRSMDDATASACPAGHLSLGGCHRTSSRTAATADLRADSTFALMVVSLIIKAPGLHAKWSSSGGLYGPLQGYLVTAQDTVPANSWEPRYFWVFATALADTCTAMVFTWAATRRIRQWRRVMMTSVLAARPTSSQPGSFSARLASLTVRAAAMLGALCSGHNLYAIPWTVAAALLAGIYAEKPNAAAEASPMAEMKQL